MGEPTTCEGADRLRLSGQLHRVFNLMRDGQPRTLRSISELVGCSEASASARLRDFRQVRIMGGAGVCVVTRQRLAPGLYAYRVQVPP
jgi:DNA-binding Lrp family transcriptional regulator